MAVRLHAVSGVAEVTEPNEQIVLTAPTNFYLNGTSGDDAHSGLTPATAFGTLQGAIDGVILRYNFGGLTHTINITDHSYAAAALASGWSGGGNLQLVGNLVNWANVTVDAGSSAAAIAVQAPLPGNLGISGLAVTGGVSKVGILVQATASVALDSVEFGACGLYHLDIAEFAKVAIGQNGLRFTGACGAGQPSIKLGEFALYTSIGSPNPIPIIYTGAFNIAIGLQLLNDSVANIQNNAFTVSGGASVTFQYSAQQPCSIVTLGNTVNGIAAPLPGTLTGALFNGAQANIDGNLGVFTSATLPSAIIGGQRAMVKDSTLAGPGNFGSLYAGGGTLVVPVYTDQAVVWRIG